VKVFSIVGVRKSGKTTVVTELIKEFKKRGYRVGSVKTIFCPTFSMDNPTSNTARHRAAGADVVCAKARNEMDIVYGKGMDNNEILPSLDVDILLLEGDYEILVPRIVCAHKEKEIDERRNEYTIAVSGQIGARLKSYENLPVFNVLEQVVELADFIEEKVEECKFPVEMRETPLAAPGFCHCGCHKAEKKQDCEFGMDEPLVSHPVNTDRKHIFLTGRKQVGKSTALKKVIEQLQESVEGYQTLPYEINGQTKGFYLHNLKPMDEYENDSPVCIRVGQQKNQSIPETYETLGVEILKNVDKNAVILLDEIGKLENRAFEFQQEVFRCLNTSRQVLGVLQRTNGVLVEAISKRSDVVVLTVTEENRDEMPERILKLMEQNNKAWRNS
jgi:molybdopterin-guanine dinucleotide biosynthesis protein MobB